MITVDDNFVAPFGKCPGLRASFVPRWGIIKMARRQSIAEHAYSVAILTKYILSNFVTEMMDDNEIVVRALEHDFEEIYTGDIPSPAKVTGKKGVDLDKSDLIIKLADVAESYIFANNNCIDSDAVKSWVIDRLEGDIAMFCNLLSIDRKILMLSISTMVL